MKDIKMFLQKFSIFFIFFISIIPSSGLNVLKYFLFTILICSFGFVFISKTLIMSNKSKIAYSGIVAFFSFSLLISIFTNSFEYAISAMLSYLGMIVVVIIYYELLLQQVITIEKFLKAFFIGIFLFMVMKLTVFFLPFFPFVDPFTLVSIIKKIVPGAAQQVFPVGGGAYLLRLTLGNDTLICFSLLLLLFTSKLKLIIISNRYKLFFLSFSIINIFLSTTRLFLIELIFGIALYTILFVKKGLLYFTLITILSISLVTYLFIAVPEIKTYYEIRMNDIESIRVKDEQNNALFKEWNKYSFFGKGIGSYTNEVIRSNYQPYQYEVQWTSLLLQFGLFGISILLFFITFFSYKAKLINEKLEISKINIYVFFLFGFFLLSGFTNPYLFIFNASINYIIFLYFVFIKNLIKN